MQKGEVEGDLFLPSQWTYKRDSAGCSKELVCISLWNKVKRLDSRIQKSPETQQWIYFFFTLLLHSQKAETGPFRGPA